MDGINCILCGENLNRRTDKNGKPYFVCDPCGTQFFVRKPQGIRNLNRVLGEAPGHSLAKISVQEIRSLKRELKHLEEHLDMDSPEDLEWIDALADRMGRFLDRVELAIQETHRIVRGKTR